MLAGAFEEFEGTERSGAAGSFVKIFSSAEGRELLRNSYVDELIERHALLGRDDAGFIQQRFL
jgi:hypothetical protein